MGLGGLGGLSGLGGLVGTPSTWPVAPLAWWNASNVYADDQVTSVTTNGANVGFWKDLSRNNYNLTSPSADGTLATNQVNGLPAVVGDGSTMGYSDGSAIPSVPQPFTIFFVMKNLGYSGSAEIMDTAPDSEALKIRQQNNAIDVVDNVVLGPVNDPGVFAIYQIHFNGASSSVTIAGATTTGTLGTDSLGNLDGFYLMQDASGSNFANVAIAECAIFQNLSGGNATQVTNTLKRKYGL